LVLGKVQCLDHNVVFSSFDFLAIIISYITFAKIASLYALTLKNANRWRELFTNPCLSANKNSLLSGFLCGENLGFLTQILMSNFLQEGKNPEKICIFVGLE